MSSTLHPVLALLAGAALVAAPVSAQAAGRARPPAVHVLAIQQMRFAPPPPGLKVGDAVEWVNNDIFVHSATAKDRSFDVELKPGAHVRMTLARAGTFPFACRYHPGMTGTLVVAGPAR